MTKISSAYKVSKLITRVVSAKGTLASLVLALSLGFSIPSSSSARQSGFWIEGRFKTIDERGFIELEGRTKKLRLIGVKRVLVDEVIHRFSNQIFLCQEFRSGFLFFWSDSFSCSTDELGNVERYLIIQKIAEPRCPEAQLHGFCKD
ncbi:hypothetical protein AAFO92_15915 [Roseovarius sp. CAU 1744]|uniref:hypothetical protein n=1 Tax=Roseovarius sp. CAU 1744 TaxID=3140368 RepID=UPI00325B17DA